LEHQVVMGVGGLLLRAMYHGLPRGGAVVRHRGLRRGHVGGHPARPFAVRSADPWLAIGRAPHRRGGAGAIARAAHIP
jgi:hypothetical protein